MTVTKGNKNFPEGKYISERKLKMEIINLTPHTITFVNDEGKTIMTIPSSGIARVASTTAVIAEFEGIPVTETTFGQIEGLPEKKLGVIYIVSRMVATASKRNDLFVPGMQVRDSEGRVIGCKSLDKA